jgi:hypothetical protein
MNVRVPLNTGQCCYWQVQALDKDAQPTASSDLAGWEMRLLEPEDWHASWITSPNDNEERQSPLFRKT